MRENGVPGLVLLIGVSNKQVARRLPRDLRLEASEIYLLDPDHGDNIHLASHIHAIKGSVEESELGDVLFDAMVVDYSTLKFIDMFALAKLCLQHLKPNTGIVYIPDLSKTKYEYKTIDKCRRSQVLVNGRWVWPAMEYILVDVEINRELIKVQMPSHEGATYLRQFLQLGDDAFFCRPGTSIRLPDCGWGKLNVTRVLTVYGIHGYGNFYKYLQTFQSLGFHCEEMDEFPLKNEPYGTSSPDRTHMSCLRPSSLPEFYRVVPPLPRLYAPTE